MGDSPAFQFYADDYLVGTMTMTLAEKGAYMDCLAYQWSVGSIPGDDHKALARVMRCSPAEARKTWAVVSGKFTREENGQWRNRRLEKEREKQAAYRESRASSGRLGGLAKGKLTFSSPSFSPQSPGVEVTIANGVAKSSSPSLSPSSDFSPPPKNGGGARGGSVVSPIEFEKLQRFNAYVGARLRVPHKLHGDFVAALGGDEPDAVLRRWYAEIDAELEQTREGIVPDVWKWLEARFKPWAVERSTSAAMDAWVKGA